MTIVVGYVPRPEGEAALRRAIEEARKSGTSLLVLNSSRGDAPIDNAYAEESDLGAVRQELDAAGVEYEIRSLVRGRDAADEIVAAAEESGAELIVIGLRRRTSVGKFILGSNAQRVLFDAPCAVLTVKPSSA